MTTYSVRCGFCGKEQLLEHAQPLDDPGTLPAFCSAECNAAYGRQLLQPMADAGHGILVDLDCGCMAIVHSAEGHGSTFPWLNCQEAGGGFENWSRHSLEVHRQAVEIVRRRN